MVVRRRWETGHKVDLEMAEQTGQKQKWVTEARLRWFEYNSGYSGQRIGESWSCQAGPPRSFMDVIKKDIQMVVVTEEDGEDRLR